MMFTDALHNCTDLCILTYLVISSGCLSHKIPFLLTSSTLVCYHGLHLHSTFTDNLGLTWVNGLVYCLNVKGIRWLLLLYCDYTIKI